MKRKVVSPKGVVIENVLSVPVASSKRSMSPIGVPPRRSSSSKVRAAFSTRNATRADAVRVALQEALGAAARAVGRGADHDVAARLKRHRALPPGRRELRAALADLAEIQAIDVEAAAALQVAHVVVHAFDAEDAERFDLGHWTLVSHQSGCLSSEWAWWCSAVVLNKVPRGEIAQQLVVVMPTPVRARPSACARPTPPKSRA